MQESKKLTEKFHIIQQISRGDHSIIYSGIDRIDGNMLAIKAEPIKIKDSRLRHEYKVYRSLAVALGLPKIYYYKETSKYRLMFMELLGLNLEELFNKCNRRFSLVTTLRLSIQIISRLESIHEQSFILRNVAPSNFCIGLDVRREIIYCTNFSLAKKFRDLDAGINHIPMTSKKRKLHISPLFSSINCMMGSGQSRKDDIESLGYMMIYFVKGGLPWENLNQHDLILQKKQNISMERLADGLPKGIKIFMKNIKSLTFESRPEYDYLRLLLLDTLSALENNNCPPDWASMIVDRDKVNIGPHGIILKSAQSNNNNLNVIKPRRPSTAIQRYFLLYLYTHYYNFTKNNLIQLLYRTSNNINQSQRQRQRPSTAISR